MAELARVLEVDELQLRQFMEAPATSIDYRFLLELLVASVRAFGVNCSYLLTGQYSYAEHCQVEAECRSRTDLQDYLSRRLSTLFRQETITAHWPTASLPTGPISATDVSHEAEVQRSS